MEGEEKLMRSAD